MNNKQFGLLPSGVDSSAYYKEYDEDAVDAEQRLAQVEPFRAQAEQMRHTYEQVRGYALGSERLDYAGATENNAIGTTDAEITNTREGFTDLLNTLISHNNLLKVNTNSSTSSAWVLEREAYMNDAPDAPDGENYSFGNIAFAIFGYDKTFTVISPYDVTEAALAITLPAMDNVNGQIAVERPDGTGFVSLQQNKRYHFRTYFDGTTPKIVLENSEPVTATASETVAGAIKISTLAQALAGEDNETAITPAKLFKKLSAAKEVTTIVSGSGISATGYTRFYDIATGEIVRKVVWGRANTLTSDNGRNINFPLTFTTIYSVNISIIQNGGNTDASPDSPSHSRDLSLTSIRLCNADALQTVDIWYKIEGR